jgi:Ca2+-binding RTX toxin-like protein
MQTRQKNGRFTIGKTAGLAALGTLMGIVACSGAGPESAPVADEAVGTVASALLAANCVVDGSGNLALTLAAGEVGYVGRASGCTVEPCVFTNAVSAGGTICRINSTGKSVTVTGVGVEKMLVDYSNGLFALATTSTPLVAVTMGAGSKLTVVSPTGGGNMALGASGLDANALLARGTPRVDVTMTGFTAFDFDGNTGNDVFTADPAGWTTAPSGWATATALGTALGLAPTTITLTVSGGAGNDILAGGGGVIATNTLVGGAGNDTFLQGVNSNAESMNGGDGVDTVDYSVRSADLTVSLDATANDGAGSEADNVGDTVEIVKGGTGNDTLSAASTLLTDVVLIGGAGNDTLTGGGGNDDLCGGLGNDTFMENLGDDRLSGGAGTDTADYSTGTGNKACLRSADATCTSQNGATGELDVINNAAVTHVCPRATLNIDVSGTPAVVTLATAAQGGAMVVDVENLTGNPAAANELHCGTLPCTLFGGSAADTLTGYTAADAIFGLGGTDTVATGGGADFVDLTHAGVGKVQTVDCHSDQVTLLLSAADVTAGPVETACTNAIIP